MPFYSYKHNDAEGIANAVKSASQFLSLANWVGNEPTLFLTALMSGWITGKNWWKFARIWHLDEGDKIKLQNVKAQITVAMKKIAHD